MRSYEDSAIQLLFHTADSVNNTDPFPIECNVDILKEILSKSPMLNDEFSMSNMFWNQCMNDHS